MTREEFEKKYAMKYRNYDFMHNATVTLSEIKDNRNGDGYHEHHLDLCWKVQKIKNSADDYDLVLKIYSMEW